MFTKYIQDKGHAYEQYVYHKLKNDKINFDNVWFFKSVPEYVIKKTKLYDSHDMEII